MGKRFNSVWDALPSGLCDLMPLTSEALIEQALFDASQELAKQKGFHLVRTANAENATRAIYGAVPIASINWTDNTENATCACCMENVRQSNE